MARWHRLFAAGVGALVLGSTALAAPQAAPGWGMVTTLAGLPEEVSSYLVEKTALADQGEPYNDSCVVNTYMPSTRFVIAAVSANETIVAIEHGGRSHGINTWSFRQEDNHWKPMEQGRVAYNVTLMTAKILVEQHQKSTHRL